MATRKGINIFGNDATPHILHALFIYVLCILKNRKVGQNRILHSSNFGLSPHILHALFIYVLCILKNRKVGQNRILHSSNFGLSRIYPNGCMLELIFF